MQGKQCDCESASWKSHIFNAILSQLEIADAVTLRNAECLRVNIRKQCGDDTTNNRKDFTLGSTRFFFVLQVEEACIDTEMQYQSQKKQGFDLIELRLTNWEGGLVFGSPEYKWMGLGF